MLARLESFILCSTLGLNRLEVPKQTAPTINRMNNCFRLIAMASTTVAAAIATAVTFCSCFAFFLSSSGFDFLVRPASAYPGTWP